MIKRMRRPLHRIVFRDLLGHNIISGQLTISWQEYTSHKQLKCRKIHQKNSITQDPEAHLIHLCTVPAIQLCKEKREEKEVLEEKEEEEMGLYKSYQSKDSFSWRNLGIPASSTYLLVKIHSSLKIVLDTKKLYPGHFENNIPINKLFGVISYFMKEFNFQYEQLGLL